MKLYYERGPVTLYHGDCLDWLPTLEHGSVDAVVTDPPYSIENKFGAFAKRKSGFGSNRRLEFEWDMNISSPEIAERIRLALKACAKAAAFFVFCGTDQVGDLLPVLREDGFTPKPAAWVKKCPVPPAPGNWWPSAFELAFYGYRNSPYFGDDDPKRCNVFVYDSYRFGQPGKVDHPTQKPLDFMERIVKAVCPEGGLVAEPFSGSGSTALACIRTGRRFVGCEISEKFCELSVKRFDAELDQGRLFAEPAPKPAVQKSLMG